jgi:hypothetical protein
MFYFNLYIINFHPFCLTPIRVGDKVKRFVKIEWQSEKERNHESCVGVDLASHGCRRLLRGVLLGPVQLLGGRLLSLQKVAWR